jgi:hypothetical protein
MKMKIVAVFLYLLTSEILGVSIADNKISVEDANIIACDSNNCEIIQQFTISETNSFDCNDENIQILFKFKINNKTVETFGYLTQSSRGLVESQQASSRFCKLIKK